MQSPSSPLVGDPVAPRLAPGSVARPSSRLDEAESKMTKLIQEVRDGGERVYSRLQSTMKEFSDSFTQTARIVDDLREGRTQSAVSGLVSVIELAQSEVGRLNGLLDETGNAATKTYEHLIKLLQAQREQKELIQSRLRELVEIKQKQVNELLTTAKRGLSDFGTMLEKRGLVRWGSNWAFKKLMAKADAVTPEQIKERERQAARVTQLLSDIERFSKGSITDAERASVKVEKVVI